MESSKRRSPTQTRAIVGPPGVTHRSRSIAEQLVYKARCPLGGHWDASKAWGGTYAVPEECLLSLLCVQTLSRFRAKRSSARAFFGAIRMSALERRAGALGRFCPPRSIDRPTAAPSSLHILMNRMAGGGLNPGPNARRVDLIEIRTRPRNDGPHGPRRRVRQAGRQAGTCARAHTN